MRMPTPFRLLALAVAVGMATTACARTPDATAPQAGPQAARSPPRSSARYLVISSTETLPRGLARGIAAAGGTVVTSLPQIGVAIVTSSNPGFAARSARLSGVLSVVPDVRLRWIDPSPRAFGVPRAQYANPPTSGDDDVLFDVEWNMAAIGAPAAWNAGLRGAGVRVAILDDGIDPTHPDLAPNVNVALSTSFVEGEDVTEPPGFYFNHGTYVAGIIGAADNAFGMIGVAPEAELVAVKVLSDTSDSGTFDGIIQGIVYAADVHADVINMSLGAFVPRHGFVTEDGTRVNGAAVAGLYVIASRATTYAYQHGSTVVAAAGNESIDRDHDRDLLVLPADLPHVISVSATAPEGWGLDPSTNLDLPASYTNYGQSRIDLAAPGGDFDLESEDTCTIGIVTIACVALDGVFGPSPGGWFWVAGTSASAPHVSGVAALIIGANGGSMAPSAVESALRASADDLGKPGKDDYYGYGRVSAGNLAN